MRRFRLVALCLALTACGGTQAEHDRGRYRQTNGGEATTDEALEAPTGAAAGGVAQQNAEPTVAVRELPSDPAAAPREDVPGHYTLVDFPAGARLSPPATACQDALLFVRSGTLVASGTGIATAAAPLTLYAGDAVRFGPEADGEVRNEGESTARTVLLVARDEGAGPIQTAGAALAAAPVAADAQRCPVTPPPADARFSETRVAHVDTTTPLVAAGGKLHVRILLDAQGQGATRGALSWLDGDPDMVVPPHRHDTSAELLLIEEGDGTMHVGDREVHVTAGSTVTIPRGVQHDFRGSGASRLRAVQVYTPGGPEQRFR